MMDLTTTGGLSHSHFEVPEATLLHALSTQSQMMRLQQAGGTPKLHDIALLYYP